MLALDCMRLPETLSTPQLARLFDAIAVAGGHGRFVGGCVRDSLLGRPIGDIDVATDLRPEAVMAAVTDAGLRAYPTGLAHGTVTVVSDGVTVEVTTLRVDVETDGRHAEVAFTQDWVADAARRDFTMNALYLDPDGRLHAPVGGIDDARNGRIVFIGDPDQRLNEDVLRLLRFFRFFARYGRYPVDGPSYAACARFVPALPRLSGERVRTELLKLLGAPDPVPAWSLAVAAGVAAAVVAQDAQLGPLQRLVALERRHGVAPDALRRLAVLVDDRDTALGIASRWRFSRAERDRLALLIQGRCDIKGGAPTLWESLLDHGTATARDFVLLAAARDWRRACAADLAEIACWTPRTLPLDGGDIVALGVAPGPAVGELLRAVKAWWIAGGLTADHAACVDMVTGLVNRRESH